MPAVSMLTTDGTTAAVSRAYSLFRRESSSTSPKLNGALSGSVKASGWNSLAPFEKPGIKLRKSPPDCQVRSADTATNAIRKTAASANIRRDAGFIDG